MPIKLNRFTLARNRNGIFRKDINKEDERKKKKKMLDT